MPLSMLREFLDRNRIRYTVISHSVAYTAQGIAALTHTPGRELAKTVMVMVDGRLAMAVVPASFRVDLYRLKKYLGAETVELASENEFRDHFADCETGSMPPFGNLYGMDVFVDQTLAENLAVHAPLRQSLRYGRFRGPDFGRESGQGQGNRLQRRFAP